MFFSMDHPEADEGTNLTHIVTHMVDTVGYQFGLRNPIKPAHIEAPPSADIEENDSDEDGTASGAEYLTTS